MHPRTLIVTASAATAVLLVSGIAYAVGGDDRAAAAAVEATETASPSEAPTTDAPTDAPTEQASPSDDATPDDTPSAAPTGAITSDRPGRTEQFLTLADGTSTHAVLDVGTVSIAVEGTTVTVLSASAADDSWRVVIETDEPGEAEVSFRRPDRRVDFKAEVEDGQLRIRIRDRAAEEAAEAAADDQTRREDDDDLVDADDLDDDDDDSLDEDSEPSDDSVDSVSEDSGSEDSISG